MGGSENMEERMRQFMGWLESRGVDLSARDRMTIAACEEGHGLFATADMPKDTTLFTIPWPAAGSPLLAVPTSPLLPRLRPSERRALSKNWLQLVLVLLWEHARARCQPDSSDTWAPYFDILPTEFDTLMFWEPSELAELTGSMVLDKIGKEEAEQDYETIIAPLIRARPDLFPVPPDSSWEASYGLGAYHRMGSLILSRSFDIQPPSEQQQNHPSGLEDISMDTASHSQSCGEISMELDQEDDQFQGQLDDSNDQGGVETVGMVPMSDLLNAKSGAENARLFYEPGVLRMKTTKSIRTGEQIFNTYGNPPNSDLLRRYGHVDDPNRFDVVEISIKTCLEVAHSHHSPTSSITLDDLKARVDWALEMGIDDVYEIPTESERTCNGDSLLPEELICILKIFLLSKDEFKIHEAKEKLPKPRLKDKEVINLAQKVIDRRLSDYPTSIDEDERALDETKGLLNDAHHHYQSLVRKLKSIIVRKSEKKILIDLQRALGDLLVRLKDR